MVEFAFMRTYSVVYQLSNNKSRNYTFFSFLLLVLWRTPRLYMLKQYYSQKSQFIVTFRIFSSMLHILVNILPLSTSISENDSKLFICCCAGIICYQSDKRVLFQDRARSFGNNRICSSICYLCVSVASERHN